VRSRDDLDDDLPGRDLGEDVGALLERVTEAKQAAARLREEMERGEPFFVGVALDGLDRALAEVDKAADLVAEVLP
jgi:hypothetical protein